MQSGPAVSDASNSLQILYFFLIMKAHYLLCSATLITSDLLIGSFLTLNVSFELKQYFYCSVITGPIIFSRPYRLFFWRLADDVRASNQFVQLRLSVLKSSFWYCSLGIL